MTHQQRNLPEILSGTRMSPFREMTRLQRSIDRLFDEMMSPLFGASTGLSSIVPIRSLIEEQMSQNFIPPVDIEENDQQFMICLDLPGVSKNDVCIETNDHQLIIRGERKAERVEEKGVRHAVERVHGIFQRNFTLPATVNVDQIQANYENGVLQIVIPKVESAHRKTIQITEGRAIEGAVQPTPKAEKKEKAA